MSLRRKFLTFILGLSLLSALFFLGVYISVDRLLFLSIDRHLSEETGEFERFYFGGGYEDYWGGKTFCIRNPEGLIIECSGVELPLFPAREPVSVRLDGKVYRLLTLKTQRGLLVQYAMDITREVEALSLLRLSLTLGWFFFLSASLLAYWLFYRSTLRSFEKGVEKALRGELTEDLYEEVKPLALKLREHIEHYRDMLMALGHSLKTPLADILLKVELLSRKRNEPVLEDIKGRLEGLSKGVTSFLRLSKVETLSYRLTSQRCNLKELLESVLLAHREGKLRVDAREVWTECDPDLIMEVFDILVDNALRHGFEGAEVLVVLSECSFTVENLSEKPLDPKIMEEPLKRGSGGVGLYIAKRLSELMGFKLTLSQEVEGELYRVRAELLFC